MGRIKVLVRTNLLVVHLELPNHLDSDVIKLSSIVFRSVYVAESAITHLFHQCVALKAWISGHFCSTFTLFGYYPLDHVGVIVDFAVLGCSRLMCLLLLGGSIASSCCHIAVVDGSSGIVSLELYPC